MTIVDPTQMCVNYRLETNEVTLNTAAVSAWVQRCVFEDILKKVCKAIQFDDDDHRIGNCDMPESCRVSCPTGCVRRGEMDGGSGEGATKCGDAEGLLWHYFGELYGVFLGMRHQVCFPVLLSAFVH